MVALDELATDLRLSLEAIRHADQQLTGLSCGTDTLGALAQLREVAVELSRDLSGVREALDNVLGDAMGEHQSIVEGVGVLKRHKKKARTKWDTDTLRRVVLDSRLVDPDTGEVKDETPVDRILAVWNLGNPRLTALRARQIDTDEFCSVEVRPGWQIEVIS